MPADIRDTCLAELALSEAALRDEVDALRLLAESRAADLVAMRLVAVQALHALHAEQSAHAKTKARYERLIAEYREHRASVLAQLGVAA